MIDWLQLWFHPERATPGEGVPDLISAALPMWAGLITTELLVSNVLGKKRYNLRQSISNLSAGLLALMFMGVVTKALHVLPYLWVHRQYRLLSWAPQHDWWMHIAAFPFCDVTFYWVRRGMHESNLGWAAHVVHHSSMDYNYTVALRQGFGESILSWAFYLPLALVCPPEMYALHRGINTVYQSFTHTELIDKLWWPIELVMVTPSHHRVHHARNYGRKNHGGILIVWDRMFGTFQEERKDRKPIYGLNAQTVTQGTFNPLWHQVHHFMATLRLARSGTVPASHALFTRVTGPGMIHPGTTSALEEAPPAAAAAPTAPAETPAAAAGAAKKGKGRGGAVEVTAVTAASAAATAAKAGASSPQEGTSWDPAFPWERRALGPLDYYAAFQFFLVVVPASFAFLGIIPTLNPGQILGGGAFSAWSLITLGWLCGGEAPAIRHELLRLVVQAALAVRLLGAASLPGVSAQVLRASVGVSCASFAFVLAAASKGRATPAAKKSA